MADAFAELRVDVSGDEQSLKDFEKGIGNALVKIEAQVKSSTSRARTSFAGFAQSAKAQFESIIGPMKTVALGIGAVVGSAAAGATALFLIAKSASQYGDNLEKARIRTGLLASELSFLKAVAEDNSASFEDVTTGMRVFNKQLSALAAGDKAAVETFKRLGISGADFAAVGNDINKILPVVIERLAGVENQSEKVSIALEIFGRGGTSLIPTINALAEGGAELREHMEKLGVVVGEQFVKDAVALDDALDDSQHAILGVKLAIGAELMPIVRDWIAQIAEWISGNRELIKQNVKEFVEGVKVAVENLKIAFGGLPGRIKDTANEFTLLKGIMIGVNEIIVLTLQGMNAVRAAKVGFAQIDVLSSDPLGMHPELTKERTDAIAKQVEEYEEAGRVIKQLKKNVDDYSKSQVGANNANRQAGITLDELNQFWKDEAGAVEDVGGAIPPVTEGTEDAANAAEDFAQSIADQVKELEYQKDSLGLSAEGLIDLEEQELQAEAATHGLNDALRAQIEHITDLKREIAQAEIFEEFKQQYKEMTEEIKQDFEGLVDSLKTEEQKLVDEQIKNFGIIDAARRRDLVSAEEAAKLKVQIEQKTNEEIQAERQKAYIQQLKDSDSFIDNLKGGFLEFVDSVQNDSETMSQFFADTLSTMSQSFADVFYNIVTGKFDSLVDVAKNAFLAILRAFIDMVAAIATKAIVVKIGGLLGLGGGTKGAGGGGAGGVLDTASGAVGAGGDLLGLLGSGGGAAGALLPAGTSAGFALPQIGGLGFEAMGAGALNAGTGLLATIGSWIPYIGAAIAVLSFALPLIMGLFKKTPRLDVDFDSVKTDMGRRAAQVKEFLDPEFFKESIAQISVKRGGVGLGKGGDEGIKDELQKLIEQTINGVIDIFAKLPTDLFLSIKQQILNAPLDIETEIAGERFFEFDAKGKKIAEKWQAFINGELQAKFLFAIRDTLDDVFVQLGVLPDKAQAYFEDRLEQYKNAGSREARAAIGAEVLADINALVDAYNIAGGTFNDTFTTALNSMKSLSEELGFKGIPSIDELAAKVKEMIANMEIDAETIEKVKALRAALVNLTIGLAQNIQNLVSKIEDLNAKIVALGGAATDTAYALQTTIDSIMSALQNDTLSLEEREALLDQGVSAVDQWAAGELQKQQAAAQAKANRINARIQGLEAQKSKVEENRDKAIDKVTKIAEVRLETLNAELAAAEALQGVYDGIKKNIQDLTLGSLSPENAFQRLQRAQAEAGSLFTQVAGASGEDKAALASQAQDILNTILSIGGEAFQQPDPEFRAIFNSTIEQLEELAKMVEPTRSIEQINEDILAVQTQLEKDITRLTEKADARLAKIDSTISSLQSQANTLQSQANVLTGEAAQKAKEYYEYFRAEYKKILDARLAQLAELGIEGNDSFSVMENLALAQYDVLVQIRDGISGTKIKDVAGGDTAPPPADEEGGGGTGGGGGGGAAKKPKKIKVGGTEIILAADGYEGTVHRPTVFIAGEGGESEDVSIRPLSRKVAVQRALNNIRNNFNVSITVHGGVDSRERVQEIKDAVVEAIVYDPPTTRRVKQAVGGN